MNADREYFGILPTWNSTNAVGNPFTFRFEAGFPSAVLPFQQFVGPIFFSFHQLLFRLIFCQITYSQFFPFLFQISSILFL